MNKEQEVKQLLNDLTTVNREVIDYIDKNISIFEQDKELHPDVVKVLVYTRNICRNNIDRYIKYLCSTPKKEDIFKTADKLFTSCYFIAENMCIRHRFYINTKPNIDADPFDKDKYINKDYFIKLTQEHLDIFKEVIELTNKLQNIYFEYLKVIGIDPMEFFM